MMKDCIANDIKERIQELLPDTTVELKEIIKNNGVALQGLTITKEGMNVGPTIYIDKDIDSIADGEDTVHDACEKILKIYEKNQPKVNFDVNSILNKENVLKTVHFTLINAEKNKKLLEEVPYKEVLDLAALYKVVIFTEDTGRGTITIRNEHMDMLGITKEELEEAATKNLETEGCSYKTMKDILMGMGMPEEMMGECIPDMDMFVVTNKDSICGANAILYKDMMNELADKLDDDLLIIPSSIHECICMRANESEDVTALNMLVNQVNHDEVANDEVLGSRVYKYIRESQEICYA